MRMDARGLSITATALPCPYYWNFDEDEDGLDDGCEQALAERFAPVFFYEHDEPNLPTSVPWFLERTELRFFDKKSNPSPLPAGCTHDHGGLDCPVQKGGLTAIQYFGNVFQHDTPAGEVFYHDGQYDPKRERTFYFTDLDARARKGSPDPSDWVTYFHVFPRKDGGVELQYWRLHAYNTGKKIIVVEIDFHGGDWEGAQVVLNASGAPTQVRFTSHTDIGTATWNPANAEGNHVKVLVESGGHANSEYQAINEANYIRHETWPGGHVRWAQGNVFQKPAGQTEDAGPLKNVGEKYHPTGDAFFIRYTGLWGSLGDNFSGWWGPGFNEGKDENNNYFEGWCGRDDDMATTLRNRVQQLVIGNSVYVQFPECAFPTRVP